MGASREQVRVSVERYAALLASGPLADLVALFTDDAVVEDPVGSPPRRTRAEVEAFFAGVLPRPGHTRTVELCSLHQAGGEAALALAIATTDGERTFRLRVVDTMTFADDGRITGLRAYWSNADLSRD